MKVVIANKVLTITNQSGVEDTRSIVYGRYFYDPNAAYVEVVDIRGDKVRLMADKITEFNGTPGTPAYSTILAALLANIKA